jgi:hypothetical protein
MEKFKKGPLKRKSLASLNPTSATPRGFTVVKSIGHNFYLGIDIMSNLSLNYEGEKPANGKEKA